ncbi:MAG: response regulator [Candidatus Solibacter sp.]
MEHDAHKVSTATVLLVEDDSRTLSVVASLLRANGFQVITAADSIQAIAAFDNSGESIDVVLSDIKMPGMNGPDLLDHLRSRRPSLRALLMSGFTDGAKINAPLLMKPFSLAELRAGLAAALASSGECRVETPTAKQEAV